MSTVLNTAAGVVLGAVIAAYFSWRSSKELRREAAELRRVSNMVLVGLAGAGLVEVRLDLETGDVLAVPVEGALIESSTLSLEEREFVRRAWGQGPSPPQSWWRRVFGG